MGDLITMTRSVASPPTRPHRSGDAEILFFTGVRYHRFENELPPQYRHSRRRRCEGKQARDEALQPGQQA